MRVEDFLLAKRSAEMSIRRSIEIWLAQDKLRRASVRPKRGSRISNPPLAPDGKPWNADIPKWPQPLPRGKQ